MKVYTSEDGTIDLSAQTLKGTTTKMIMVDQSKIIAPSEEVRALSWKQPFASAMLHGKIETRTWDTKYRGLVLICASKQPYGNSEFKNIAGPVQEVRISELFTGEDDFEFGKAIAVGRLVDTWLMGKLDEDKCFVKYAEGLWCHVYEDVRAIKPFPWKGTLSWKVLSPEQKELIQFI